MENILLVRRKDNWYVRDCGRDWSHTVFKNETEKV